MRPVNIKHDDGGGMVREKEEVRVTSVILGLVMVIALIVTAAAWMGGSLSRMESRLANFTDATARTFGLAVNDVTVIGLENKPSLAAEIRAAAMIEPGENTFRADPYRIRERIEATRKVVNVRVHRLWPDQVVIMADPADPLALWEKDGTWHVIDELGRDIPGVSPESFAQLPALHGAGAPQAAPDLFAQLRLQPGLRARLVAAERVSQRRWRLHFEGGVRADLPADEQLPGALVELAGMNARHRLLDRALAAIDLRVPGQFVFRPLTTNGGEGAA